MPSRRDGRPYGRRRIQLWVADAAAAGLFVWRDGIPGVVTTSWQAFLDDKMAAAGRGAIARTGRTGTSKASD